MLFWGSSPYFCKLADCIILIWPVIKNNDHNKQGFDQSEKLTFYFLLLQAVITTFFVLKITKMKAGATVQQVHVGHLPSTQSAQGQYLAPQTVAPALAKGDPRAQSQE